MRKASTSGGAAGGDAVIAPMQGTIVKVVVEDGQSVAEGDTIGHIDFEGRSEGGFTPTRTAARRRGRPAACSRKPLTEAAVPICSA